MSAQLSRSPAEESQLSFISPQISTKFSTIPARRAQFQYECPQVSHVTTGQWDSDYSLDSKSTLKNRNQFLNFAVKHSPLRMTQISTQIPIGSADFELTNQQRARLALNSKHPNYPFSHVSEVAVTPSQWVIDSVTANGQSQNIFALNSKIQNLSQPSTLETRIGNQFSAKSRVLPFREIVVEAKHPNYAHVSSFNYDPDQKSVQLKSRTDSSSGRPLAKIDAFLTPRSGQYI